MRERRFSLELLCTSSLLCQHSMPRSDTVEAKVCWKSVDPWQVEDSWSGDQGKIQGEIYWLVWIYRTRRREKIKNNADFLDLVGLELFLEDHFARKVDVVSKRSIKRDTEKQILSEVAYVWDPRLNTSMISWNAFWRLRRLSEGCPYKNSSLMKERQTPS